MEGTCICCKWHIEGIYWISECCNQFCDHYGDYCAEQNEGNECECREYE